MLFSKVWEKEKEKRVPLQFNLFIHAKTNRNDDYDDDTRTLSFRRWQEQKNKSTNEKEREKRNRKVHSRWTPQNTNNNLIFAPLKILQVFSFRSFESLRYCLCFLIKDYRMYTYSETKDDVSFSCSGEEERRVVLAFSNSCFNFLRRDSYVGFC